MTSREFDFTLVLEGICEINASDEDALFEAGCDDATISVRSGRVFLTFSREAPSIKDAIISAVDNVKDSKINARVLRVDVCDLVTPKPPDKRRDEVFSIKLTAAEKRLLVETNARSWARDVLLRSASRRSDKIR